MRPNAVKIALGICLAVLCVLGTLSIVLSTSEMMAYLWLVWTLLLAGFVLTAASVLEWVRKLAETEEE